MVTASHIHANLKADIICKVCSHVQKKKKSPPPILGFKESTLAVFPTATCKSYFVPFFSAMGPYKERSNPKTSAPVFAGRHLGSLWSRTGSFCFLLQCKLFFFLLVYFNSQILLTVVRVRGIKHV